MSDPADLSATGLSASFGTGALDPVTATGAALDRIARLDPVLNAFRLVDAEAAMARAQASLTAPCCSMICGGTFSQFRLAESA